MDLNFIVVEYPQNDGGVQVIDVQEDFCGDLHAAESYHSEGYIRGYFENFADACLFARALDYSFARKKAQQGGN